MKVNELQLLLSILITPVNIMLSERVSCQEMKIVFFKFNRLVVSDCIQARGCSQ